MTPISRHCYKCLDLVCLGLEYDAGYSDCYEDNRVMSGLTDGGLADTGATANWTFLDMITRTIRKYI